MALVIGAAALVLMFALLIAAVVVTGNGEVSPSNRAFNEIPQDLIPLYQAASETCEGMDWTLLAAVHRTETSFGRGTAVSSAGALGPMQFMPATWATYGVDGDGDGDGASDDVVDAVFGAANYLCANGAGDPTRLRAAVFNYNHSLDYVDEVLSIAASYGSVQVVSTTATRASGKSALSNPRILLSEAARSDIKKRIVDGRILSVLDLISRRFTIAVSVLKSGHRRTFPTPPTSATTTSAEQSTSMP